MTPNAFYPTNDSWFWVGEEPTWTPGQPPAPADRRAFSKKVVWEKALADTRVGVCADGLVFLSADHEDDNDLATPLYKLNALNLLFVSCIRPPIDAGIEWISRTSCIRSYEPDSGRGGTGDSFSRSWAGLTSRVDQRHQLMETLVMRHFVELDVIAEWWTMAERIFSTPVRVRLLAEYALAISLFHDHNFGGALTHSWFVSEHLFSAKWQSEFPSRSSRTPAGQKIDDLKDYLGKELHSDLDRVKDIRNELAHAAGDARVVTFDDANLSFRVADRLVAREWELVLRLADRGLTY